MGAHELGPWVGELKPQGKTRIGGNRSPDITYLPTHLRTCFYRGAASSVFELCFLVLICLQGWIDSVRQGLGRWQTHDKQSNRSGARVGP